MQVDILQLIMASSNSNSTSNGSVQPLKTGYLFKQGGGYRNWKKRYFVLEDSTLCYYTKEGEAAAKGTIDLATGRGVRSKEQCRSVEKWPNDANDDTTFGLAVEKRTYFIYGSDKDVVKEWMTLLQQRIEKIGNPTNSYEKDPEGKPETLPSKLAKQGSKLAATFTKTAVRAAAATGAVDADTVELVDGITDAVENQAEAGRDASLADRAKMAAGDTAGVVGDNVDNTYVSTAASVVQEQIEADDDTSLQQRVLMSTGTVLGGAAEVIGEENEIAGALVGVVGGVVSDQAEADEDMSVKQRLILAGGSALAEGGGVVGDLTGVQLAADVLEVAGEVVKGQAEADEDSSLTERSKMAVGNAAEAVAGLDSMHYNYEGKRLCHEVESMAA